MKKYTLTHKLQNSAAKSKKRRKILLAIFILLVALPLVTLAACIGGYAVWASGMHIDDSLLPTASARPAFYDSDGARLDVTEDDYVREDEAPGLLKAAFVAIEDKRFYSHKGYDPIRIAGAALKNLKAGGVKEGASTITQQLVKNTHLSGERSIERKLKEIALAADLEKKYTKEEILCMYLSVIYFGSGAYGVKSAARTFFDKEISELTLSECAALAGIVKNPAGFSPIRHPDALKKRRNVVLEAMREQGYVSKEQCDEASAEEIAVREGGKDELGCELYIKMAKDEACERLGMTKYQLDNSGAQIYTNLVREVQTSLVREKNNKENFESENIMSYATVVDNATGAVLGIAASGGAQALRQTGSVLKPLAVYAPALDMHAVTLATPVVDERVDFAGFSPENHMGKYYGETNVAEGIKRSMNSVSVKVLDYLGLENSARYLKNFGLNVREEDKNYSLALGTLCAYPQDIAAAYSALAAGGTMKRANFVRYAVTDGIKTEFHAQSRYAISPAAASLMSAALVETVKDGTARTLSTLPFEVAAKTGTVERADGKNSDAWLASYTDDYTVTVWHGSDIGMSERGGGYPAMHARRIWQSAAEILPMKEKIDLESGTVRLDVDSYSTKALKQVVLASKRTPAQYRESMYFDAACPPQSGAGLFDGVSPCPMSVDVTEGRVNVRFDALPIYEYNLYRTDAFGRALIYSTGGEEGNIALKDMPVGLGMPVHYELVCSLKEWPEINAISKRTIIQDLPFDM